MHAPAPRLDLRHRPTVAAPVVVAMLAVLAGVGLRLWHVAAQPLWLDEAYSAYAADHGFAWLWRVVPRYETHPPAYYALVRAWSLAFGQTLGARRALGLLCGIAALPLAGAAAAAAARAAGWRGIRLLWLAALAAGLLALHPLATWMSRQVRPYPVMTLVYAVGVLLVLGASRRPAARVAGVAACEAVLLWLHTLGPLFAGSLALALLAVAARRERRWWAWFAGTQAAAALLYLPAFAIMLGQAPTWVSSTWLRFRPAVLRDQLGLLYVTWGLWPQLLGAAAALAGAAMLGRRAPRMVAALAILTLLPTVASILLSVAVAPVFLVRVLSPVTVPGLVLVAAGCCPPGRLLPGGLAAAAALLAQEVRVELRFQRHPPIQHWYETLDWLLPRMRPGDVVWAYPNEGALPLGYALRDRGVAMPVRAIPAPVPAFGDGGYYVSGSRGVVSLYPAEIAHLLRTPAATRPPTIWLLRLGPWAYDPGDRMLRALETDRAPVGHWRAGPIDLIGLRLRRVGPAAAAAAR